MRKQTAQGVDLGNLGIFCFCAVRLVTERKKDQSVSSRSCCGGTKEIRESQEYDGWMHLLYDWLRNARTSPVMQDA